MGRRDVLRPGDAAPARDHGCDGALGSLEAGTASFHDVAWLATSRRMAARIGGAVVVGGRGATLRGIVGVAVGLAIVGWPEVSLAALVVVLAICVVVMGSLRLRAALEFGSAVRIRWVRALLALLGSSPAALCSSCRSATSSGW